jgi:hypothetical protein
MNQQSVYGINPAAARTRQLELAQRRVEFGRRGILAGCLFATIGMVTFCYSAFKLGPDGDLYSTLFQNGYLGWGAFLFLVVGVGMWISGNVTLLKEAERAEHEG